MIYIDTSVIVKLYVKEQYSRESSNWLRHRDEAIPLTPFHEVEFTNAIKLKRFRKEMTGRQVGAVLERFKEHELRGVFYRPQIHWADTLSLAIDLSTEYTEKIGSRSLDVIHVALALSLKADGFLTFDDKQSNLAIRAGLRVEHLGKT
jgi:predicted nucleic acid-binding protein